MLLQTHDKAKRVSTQRSTEDKPLKTIEETKDFLLWVLKCAPRSAKKGNNFGQLEYLKLKGLKVKQILVFRKNQTSNTSATVLNTSATVEHISNTFNSDGKHNSNSQDNSGGV